jgi:hypothetical protein
MAVGIGTDWLDDDEEDDDDLDAEDLAVEVAVESGSQRVACVYTRGLWSLGLPELYFVVPGSFRPAPGFDWSRLAFLLASTLMVLGHELIDVDHFDLEPYEDLFDGSPVEMWLGPQEAPTGRLVIALGEEVDTVIRVECSLWSGPLVEEDG